MKSDSQLKADVSEELKWEPSVNATQIGVEVKDGVVTLAGHVDSYAEKWHAERAAQRVSGVKALAVEMTRNHLLPDGAGKIHAPDAPGLGIGLDASAVQRYQIDVELRVAGRTLYQSPTFAD